MQFSFFDFLLITSRFLLISKRAKKFIESAETMTLMVVLIDKVCTSFSWSKDIKRGVESART